MTPAGKFLSVIGGAVMLTTLVVQSGSSATQEKISASSVEQKPSSVRTNSATSAEVKVTPVIIPPTRQVESSCHPSYSGCLRMNAGDYDCASGSGNGPNYTGRVEVYGSDPFDLDRDNDGVGCE